MRLAWFSPLPPARVEAAGLAVSLLRQAVASHLVDVFTGDEYWLPWARWTGAPTADLPYVSAQPKRRSIPREETLARQQEALLAPSTWRGPRTPAAPLGHARLFRAWEFIFAEQSAPYDLKVYQMGNDPAHDFVWPHAFRWPGLVMLHQADLHDARARRLLYLAQPNDYRAEFAYNHPGIDPRAPEYVIAEVEDRPTGLWPMVRALLERARGVVVHNTRLLQDLRQEFPGRPLRLLTAGVQDVPAATHRPGPPVVAAIGPRLAPRLKPLVGAFAALVRHHPDARLILLDETAEALAAAVADIDARVRARIDVRGYVPDAALAPHLAEASIVVSVRWPTWRETSTRWLQALAAGLPTVVADETTLVDLPLLEPIDWTLLHARDDAAATLDPPTWREAVAISVDVRREETMIRQALLRLARDDELRSTLGANARRFWEAHHTEARMQADLAEALEWCRSLPVPAAPPDFPAHLRADGTDTLRRTLEELGATTDLL
jgi:glycosyltransferase involved in cell wall biosynthesis